MVDGTERYWESWGPHVAVQIDGGDWRSAYTNLARYVSPPAVEEVPLLKVARQPAGDASPRADERLAQELYERLAALSLSYALEPRLPRGHGRQRIRHPAWLVHLGWGTCLDLAVTYAAMCENEELAPLLVVGGGHAFVALIPGRSRDLAAPLALPGCQEDATDPGVLRVTDHDRFAEAAGLLAVECTCAVRHGDGTAPTDFATAVSAGADALRRPGLRLIDVARIHEPPPIGSGVQPLEAPRSLLGIGLHLPGGIGGQTLFGGQAAVLNRLTGARGVHVVAAERGFGKSTVARRLVAAAPFGAGWFLGASDGRVLTNSLAAAELAERNRPAGALWDLDRAGYAETARNRLGEARHAWVVVLDNADDNPHDMLRRLPTPDPSLGQLVVVTTTNVTWAAESGLPTHHLEPLTRAEAMSELDDEGLVSLVGGRPLLVTAFQRLAQAIGVPPRDLDIEQHAAATATDGPSAYWAAARGLALDDDDVLAARCARFLPPDAVSVDALDALHPQRLGTARLRDVGLLEHVEGEDHARLHRLFRDAIAADLTDTARRDEATERVLSTPEATANLTEFGDLPLVYDLLEAVKRRAQDAPGPTRAVGTCFHAVGGVLELRNDTPRSAEAYEAALDHLDRALAADRPIVAECLLGMARPKNQHGTGEADFRVGLDWADQAYEMMERDGAAARAGKYLAMRGLLTVKLAERAGLTREQMVIELESGLKMIEAADALRQSDPATTAEELARSAFNRARPYVRLADRDRANAAQHLQEAHDVYQSVLQRRQAFYPQLDAHGHIAVCIWGRGLVHYLRAMWTSASPAEQQKLLRNATVDALESARQREALAWPDDNDDVAKSYRLIAKIALARHLLPRRPGRRDEEHAELMAEVDAELRDGTLLG